MSRREDFEALQEEAAGCRRCPQLAAARTQVVFGAGNPGADLLLVGEAPRRTDDEQGFPLAGRAGTVLTELLEAIGLRRDDVYVTTVLKCRPAGNRDPLPQEVANCQDYLYRQVGLIEPKVVGTLGNFATKLLRCDSAPVTRLHGQVEVRAVGPRMVRLVPLFDLAAALYRTELLDVLREDMGRIPALLAMEAPEQPVPATPPPPPEPEDPDEEQLGLF